MSNEIIPGYSICDILKLTASSIGKNGMPLCGKVLGYGCRIKADGRTIESFVREHKEAIVKFRGWFIDLEYCSKSKKFSCSRVMADSYPWDI